MFGERLKKVRKEKGLTQQQLAILAEVSKTTISGWENNANYPSLETFIKVCKILDASADYLLELNDELGINVTGLPADVIEHLQGIVDYMRNK